MRSSVSGGVTARLYRHRFWTPTFGVASGPDRQPSIKRHHTPIKLILFDSFVLLFICFMLFRSRRRAMLEAHREALRERIAELEETASVIDRKIETYTEMESST